MEKLRDDNPADSELHCAGTKLNIRFVTTVQKSLRVHLSSGNHQPKTSGNDLRRRRRRPRGATTSGNDLRAERSKQDKAALRNYAPRTRCFVQKRTKSTGAAEEDDARVSTGYTTCAYMQWRNGAPKSRNSLVQIRIQLAACSLCEFR